MNQFKSSNSLPSRGDVEALRRQLDASRANEIHLAKALDSASIGTWKWHYEEELHYWDDNMKRLFGLDPDQCEADTLDTFWRMVHPDDVETVRQALDITITQGLPYDTDFRVIWPDGSLHWLNSRAHPIDDKAQCTKYLIGSAIDISSRKQQEEAFLETESLFHNLFHHAATGVVILDSSERFVRINPAFEKFVGYTEDELIGQKVEFVTHPEDIERSDNLIRDQVNFRYPVMKIMKRYRHKDGRDVWGDVTATIILDEFGDVRLNIGLVQDITERKLAEDEAQAIQRRLSAAQRLANIGVFERDLENSNLYWSYECYSIFGRSKDQLPISRHEFEELVHPEDRAAVTENFNRLVRYGTPYKAEYRVIRPDGGVRRVISVVDCVKDRAGKVVRLYGTLRDVSEEFEREIQLRQFQKMEAVGQLTGGIAHDFNNLLMAIQGNLDLLKELAAENKELQERLARSSEIVQRGSTLTQRLLAFSRKQTLRPSAVDVIELVNGMTDMMSRTLGEAIKIKTHNRAGIWTVRADRNQLENAILNLAINARDAMPNGGYLGIRFANVTLSGDEAECPHDLNPGDYVSVEIEDTGIGIDSDAIDRVVEPFFTTKEFGRGSGLGLSMVYGFVSQSGGTVKIESETGRGTKVTIYLPCFDEGRHHETSDAVPEPVAHGRGEVVMVIEDDWDVRDVTIKSLENMGYQVIDGLDGTTAIDIAARIEGRLDIVLADVVLAQGKNGIDLAKSIQAIHEDAKILLMSGYANNHPLGSDSDGECGELPLLLKPFGKDDLFAKIRELIDRPA